jgi:hypothetical protein
VGNGASQFSMHAIKFCHEKEEVMLDFPVILRNAFNILMRLSSVG